MKISISLVTSSRLSASLLSTRIVAQKHPTNEVIPRVACVKKTTLRLTHRLMIRGGGLFAKVGVIDCHPRHKNLMRCVTANGDVLYSSMSQLQPLEQASEPAHLYSCPQQLSLF